MRVVRVALPFMVALVCAAPAAACVSVGVYQDDPATSLPGLDKSVGPGITVISTYLTAGQPLAQSVIDTANREHAGLLVTWDPDGGSDNARQPHYRLTDVADGRYDTSLKALVAQLRSVQRGAILRPMPEMNTPWYAWSGTVNRNSPSEYIKAWKRVRQAVRSAAGGGKIRLLWAPYAWSIPDTTANEIQASFPGASLRLWERTIGSVQRHTRCDVRLAELSLYLRYLQTQSFRASTILEHVQVMDIKDECTQTESWLPSYKTLFSSYHSVGEGPENV